MPKMICCEALSRLPIIFLIFGCVCLKSVLCIVGRDLVLTPQQGLQLNGKRIYYEEDTNQATENATTYPWERTLKHVTFVTLFTDAAVSAVDGNISKLKEYTDFLSSPYIRKLDANPIRFGDIVMLANGRLERIDRNSFRFIEGNCGYDCEAERVWALWQVQKIRHRDQNNNFRYEMKFSISPLRKQGQENFQNNENHNTESIRGDMYVSRNALKTYIQKEDDYPRSFDRIVYPEETAFAQKRKDEKNITRNFRQANRQTYTDYQQVTPIPQPTFLRGVYQAPPPGLPHVPERLNIGEYVPMMGHPLATSKIEYFPNVHNNLNAHRNNFLQPTTFRPNYQVKFPRPEIYPPLQNVMNFPEDRRSLNLNANKLNAPRVTHHFHHHFFMPGSDENAGDGNSAENQISNGEFEKDINQQVTPNFQNIRFETTPTPKMQHDIPPAPQKISFPIQHYGDPFVEVTPPTSPLRKPQGYSLFPYGQNVSPKMPVLVYPIPAENPHPTARPFVQTESFTEPFRFSEPDPLYDKNGELILKYIKNQEVEAPVLVEAQLPSPEKDLSPEKSYSNGDSKNNDGNQEDSEVNHSEKDVQISTQKTTDTTIKTETPQADTLGSNTTTTTTSTTTTTTGMPTTQFTQSESTHVHRYLTTSIPTTTETATVRAFIPMNGFISTSTAETPLRSIGRKRGFNVATTTAEPAVLKWKSKRRNQHSQVKHNSKHVKHANNRTKLSHNQEEILSPLAASSLNRFNYTSATREGTATGTPSPHVQQNKDNFEVLTQKSVSKSVSIKVGNNGEEIPFLCDDDVVNNEVRKD